jgi:hypothetical protein
MSWQPIESAPKDGSGVIVICMGAEKPEAGQGWFIGGKWTTIDPGVEAEFGEDFYHASTWVNPTHWMPLPEPPEAV